MHKTSTTHYSLEQLQSYTSYLEELLLTKFSETTDLSKIMESRVEEMRQKQLEHERIMIHQSRSAAIDETLGIIAHKWRQPLNAISLSVQNLKDAWECGEVDEEFVSRTTFRVMEQIRLLSQTIDDYRSYIMPSGSAEHCTTGTD